MMSLFSSFDMKFFYLQWFLYFISFYYILNSVYKIQFLNSFINMTLINLEVFFNSMKPSPFNKFFCYKILGLMIFIFFLNFLGVWPYNFSLTSQVSIVSMLALIFWISLIIYGILSNLKGFLSHLVPEGTPIYLTWFLFLIELVSNTIRPLTLTVRLVANILAGHLLMILLYKLVYSNFMIFPLYILLNAVEIFVSLIQSYIFVTMLILYFAELE